MHVHTRIACIRNTQKVSYTLTHMFTPPTHTHTRIRARTHVHTHASTPVLTHPLFSSTPVLTHPHPVLKQTSSRQLRKLVIDLVLGTDMKRHMDTVGRFAAAYHVPVPGTDLPPVVRSATAGW